MRAVRSGQEPVVVNLDIPVVEQSRRSALGGQHPPGSEILTPEGTDERFLSAGKPRRCRTGSIRARLADRIEQRLVGAIASATPSARSSRRPTCSSWRRVDQDGQPSCSYKGGAPGFVRVVDARTLAFPNYDGNGMFLSMGNIAQQPQGRHAVHRLRASPAAAAVGRGEHFEGDPLLAEYPEAQFIVRVALTHVFPNCPRYIHQYRLVERSSYVPTMAKATPIPNWKKSDWACDVLPRGDPART